MSEKEFNGTINDDSGQPVEEIANWMKHMIR